MAETDGRVLREAATRRAAAMAGMPAAQARKQAPNDGDRARSLPFDAQLSPPITTDLFGER